MSAFIATSPHGVTALSSAECSCRRSGLVSVHDSTMWFKQCINQSTNQVIWRKHETANKIHRPFTLNLSLLSQFSSNKCSSCTIFLQLGTFQPRL